MFIHNQYPLSSYRDITPLCEKGHVVLVQNELNGQLYVKKYLQCYNPEIYFQLYKHPVNNVPAIYGIYEETSGNESFEYNYVIIEEYLHGSTLNELLEEGHIFTEKETLNITMQLCHILMDLHGLKPAIIHRDIKPSNIILSPDGKVRLLDFNAAKGENNTSGRDTVLLGTAGFAAPEQYGFSSSSPRTDIYAVGVLINILLSRKLPFEQIADSKLKDIIRHCLELNPKDRYQNVQELYHALKHISNVKSKYLLPGFRTMKIYKMIPATITYIFIIALLLTDYNFDTVIEAVTFRAIIVVFSMLTIAFYCNYLNIRRFFPFMRSGNKWLRLFGLILAPNIIFWGMAIIATVIESFLL